MALKDIAINIKATGVETTASSMKSVSTAAGTMGREVTSATSRMEADWARVQKSISDSTTASGLSFGELSRYVEQAVAAFAGFRLVKAAQEATMFAANVEQADRALSVIANTMGRTSAEAMAYRDSLRDLGITTNSATNAVAQFMKAGLPLDGLNKLGRAAQGAAISYQMMTGEMISSSAALDKMIRALVTGNVTELHTLGINVMMRDTLRENRLATGEAASSVDSHKRHLLMFNEVLEKTQPLMLLYEKSMDLAAKQISSSKRPLEEMKLALGNLFLPELTVAATAFYSMVSGGMKWVRLHNAELEETKSIMGDVSGGLVAATVLFTAYAVAVGATSVATGGLTAGAGILAGVLPLLTTQLSLTGAEVVTTKTAVSAMGDTVTVASSKSTLGLMSLKTVFSGLAAFMAAWEFGKLLSNEFAIVRQTGTAMVYGMIAAWKELSFTVREFWEVLKGQSGWTGAVNKIQAERKAWREEHARMLKEQWADNAKDPVGAATRSPYLDDPAVIAAGKKAEADRLKREKEAAATAAAEAADKERRIAEQQASYNRKIWEAERALIQQGQKDEIAMSEITLKEQLALLKQYQEQGLISEQDALDRKYAMEREQSLKKLALLNAEAHAAYEVYAKTSDDPHTDRLQQINDWNRYEAAVAAAKRQVAEIVATDVLKPGEDASLLQKQTAQLNGLTVQLLEATGQYEAAARAKAAFEITTPAYKAASAEVQDLIDALAELNAEEARRKELGSYLTGLGQLQQAIGDTVAATRTQIEMESQGRDKLDENTQAILRQIDALKLRKAEFDLAHGNDQLKDEVALGAAAEYRRQELAMEQSYRRQIELEKEKYAVMVQGSAAAAAQLERINLLEKKHQQESQEMTKASWKNNVASIADSMGQIGQILMQGNKEQFEAGKAMMYAQAVMGAALAIIQAYAQLGPIAGTVAAVGIGLTTAVQIATIADTEYKPRAQGGPVDAGGYYLVGEQGPELIRMGSAGTVIPNHALAQAGEKQLKATTKNTEAIVRLVDIFHEVKGSLSDLVLQSTNNGLVANRIAGMALDKPGKRTAVQTVIDAVVNTTMAPIRTANATLSSLGALFSGDWKKLGEGVKTIAQSTWDALTLGFGGSLFGGKKSISGAGVVMGYNGGNLNATQYTDVHTSGGIFAHSKDQTFYTALDAKLLNSFNEVARGVERSVRVAGEALGGLTLDISSVTLASRKLDLRGMSEEQANKALEDWFSQLGSAMADKLGGPEAQAQLEAVRHFGENSYQALMRITIALQTVNEAATVTGQKLLDTSKEIAIANAEIASSLIDSFGGLDSFVSAIDKYNKVVNSDEAYKALQLAAAHRSVTSALADQNVTVPQTVAQYRALVESTDMTSPLYRTLIGLADQFAVIGDAADAAADQMKTLQETLFEMRTSTDNGASPEDRYNTLSTTFSWDASQALMGDVDARGRIAAEASAFLAASRDYYGSGSGYQNDYRSVTATLTRIMEELSAANGLDLPQFASGTPRLPADMTARVHANEMIIDAQSSEVLRHYGIQIKSESSEGSEEQKETNQHLAALVSLQAEANRQMIEKLDTMERRLAGLEATARRQQAA